MIFHFLIATAMAGDRILEFTFSGPNGEIAEETWTLPAETATYEVDVGGIPHVVTVTTENRHDTVVVVAAVDYLKGKKLKPERVSEAKLILYESYPGEVTHTTEVPKGYAGPPVGELAWTTGAVWSEQSNKPAPVEPAVEEPAVDDPALEDAAVEEPAPVE